MYKRVKKDTKWTFQYLDKFKIDSLKKEISDFDAEWLLDTSRQDNNGTHRDTKMFRLCATDYDWVPGSEVITEYVNSFKLPESNNELNNIYKILEEEYSGKVIRCEVISMRANVDIPKHVDGGPLLNYSRRIHIPIITNKDVTFTVMNDTINMEEGFGYEINNQMQHSVSNKSNYDRIHIIIDVLPDDMVNYKITGE